ncbi:ABC transporter permease [Sanyastnella coralliicola]|uniref:ABC transporter permease n=1 Tax=Sanyastnella coralliicola TaxID=3069118 RepID=UPI0027B93AAF|nr:ABC transporter permease [Longitalea sp. SCSIO 12813]
MFDRDKWLEIFHTIVQNPLRTLLTGVSVALGIFILVVMQGLGFGLQNGVYTQIQDDAINSLWIRSGRTSLPFRGLNSGRRIQYDNDDLNWTLDNIEGVGDYSARVAFWGASMNYGRKTMSFPLRGIHPGHQEIERTDIANGRYINESDLIGFRKVCVVGQVIVDDLFEGADPIGEYLMIRGVQFKVVGTFNDPNSRWENRLAYVPISSAQKLFGKSEDIDMYMISTGTANLEESIEMANEIEAYLKEHHRVNPNDNRAVRVRNNNEEFREFMMIFLGIRLFIWAIGSLTLLAGMIGVANIMSIVVAERTKEIGIRKALGATPRTILSLIVQESIFLSLVAGCCGLVAGIGLLELIASFVDHDFFKNPSVDFTVCVIALGLLVISGAISGLIPALRAVSIKPVEALRDE